MNFLLWSHFLIIVSSSACIGNRNHFRTHMTSGPNSHWIIGEQQASEWGSTAKRNIDSCCTCTLASYPQPPPLKKNSPDLHQSQEWSLAKMGWTWPPQSTPAHGDAPGLWNSLPVVFRVKFMEASSSRRELILMAVDWVFNCSLTVII